MPSGMFVVVALAAAAGCAHLPACPAEGGPRWTQWSSPHFRLLTDIEDEEDAEALATQLEHFRAAIVSAAWPGVPETGEPIEVAVFASGREANVFLPYWTLGRFYGYLGTGIVLAPATNQFARAQTLKHEIVHALMRQLELDRNAPTWFTEGVAMYLAMTSYTESSDEVSFGAGDEKEARLIGRRGLCPWNELWSWPTDPMEKQRHYATSWLFVHYLFNRERERFQRFQAGLAGARDAKALWGKIFPDLATPEAFEQALDRYTAGSKYSTYNLVIPRPHFDFITTALPDAEVHALRALVFASLRGSKDDANERARAELAESLRQDPMNLRARLLERMLVGYDASDLPTAQALTSRYPSSWQAWLVLAATRASLLQEKETWDALQRARSFGFRGDLPVPTRPNVAAPY
jgi:hypothetical protein